MKKLIFKKFYKDFSGFFLIILFLTGIIVWTVQAVNFFDYVTEDGHGLKIYFYYSIFNFPKIIHGIFPFIFFISIFYMIIRYEKKNEMFIFWINGINKLKFVNGLILISFIFMLFQIILGSYVSPKTKLNARNYLKESNIDFFTSLIKEGKFINIAKDLTIFIENKNEDGNLKNIFLEERNKNNNRIIYAKNGFIIDDDFRKSLRLQLGRVINFQNSEVKIFDFDQIDINLNKFSTKTITTPKLQEIDTKTLLSCFFNIKIDEKKFKSFKCSENLIKEIKLELVKRIFQASYIPVLVLISCYLILFSKIQKNYNFKTNLIFIIGILILVFSEVASKYLISKEGFFVLYLIIPFIIFSIFYLNLYLRMKNA